MTENKAVELLEYIRETGNGEAPYVGCAQNIAIEMAITSLTEIQQYRAIGTVEEIQNMKDQLLMVKDMCKDYYEIGTIEEFKEMKSGDFTEHLLNMGYTKGYNKAIEQMQGNLIRNSRTEVIDGKICFVVTDERIKQIADIMKTQ